MEGFAYWLEIKGVKAIEPTWNTDEIKFDHFCKAIERDSRNDVKAIVYSIDSPDLQKLQLKDQYSIIYHKTAAVIGMMEDYFGESGFQKALQHFLERNQHSTVVTEDLWEWLQTVTGFNAKAIFDDWVRKPGFPFIRVQRNGNVVKLKQKRFVRGEESENRY